MSAKRAAAALLHLDVELAEFSATIEPGGYDPDKEVKVTAFVRENVMNTWSLALAAQSAGVTERQVVGALLELDPLRCKTQGGGRAIAAHLFKS